MNDGGIPTADAVAADAQAGGLRGLARFSVNHRIAMVMLILIIALFGVVAFFGLGLDLIPDIEFPQVTVVTSYPGAAPEDVEAQVTRQIEAQVATVKNVKSIYSVSREGSSAVSVNFEWGTNIDFAAQDVRDKVAFAERFLPEDAESPMVMKFDPSQMPVMAYAVTGMENTMVLREYVEDVISPRLERIDGVASSLAVGGLTREINVILDADRLKAQSVSVDQVMGALRRENVNISGGEVVKGAREHLLRTVGEYRNLDQIGSTVVAMRGATAVRVSDVARVEDTHAEIRHLARVNGRDNVMLMVMKQSGANTSTVCRAVREALEAMKPDLPAGFDFADLMDQGDNVDSVVTQTTWNALEGAVLAVAFIFLFLWSWRPTVTIAVTIPLSILATFIGMYALGYTFNLITLGGLALGVGMLVDSAVVVIENTFRHLEAGEDRRTAAVNGAAEVGTAITASTFTTMAVFLPMVIVGGIAGQMSRSMALTVCVALAASLFVAVTLVPAIASLVFRAGTAADYAARFERGWFQKVRAGYQRALGTVLRHRLPTMTAVGIAVGVAVWGVARLGTNLMPQADNPMIIMQMKLPVGTPLDQTNRVVRSIEESAAKLPGVKHVAVMIGPSTSGPGSASGMGAADVNEAMFIIRLRKKNERAHLSSAIVEDIRARLPEVRGARFSFMDMGMAMMGTSAERLPIAVRVFGPELPVLRRLGEQVTERMKGVEGLRDVLLGTEEGKPEMRIVLDRDRAAEQGLSVYQVASTAKTAVLGTAVGKFRLGGDEWDLRVRFDEKHRNSVEKVEDIEVLSPTGDRVRLGNVADIEYDTGPLRIAREGQERKVAVTCNIAGRDIGAAVADIKAALADLRLPRGYYVDYGGTYKDMQDTFAGFGWAMLAAVILLYMIMAATFESLSQPFVIMFTVPLAFVGVVAGLAISGTTLSLPSLMGLVILTGIVVNNGIVMIDHVNQLRHRGVEKHEAIITGAVTRLRPILITSITTILGILPMAFSTSEGAEMRAPMGIAIASGLTFAMVLTLFVVPVVYSLVDRISFRAANRVRAALHGVDA